MGSGLILLVIVLAWVAVLVPMVLRSTDVNSLGGVDKFHDAMRVLSRRTTPRGAAEPEDEPVPERAPTARRAEPLVERRSPVLAARRAAAARRRRLLIGLVVVALGTLGGGLAGPRWLLVAHLVVDLLLVAFVVHLRRLASRRADRDMRSAMRDRPVRTERPAAARPARPAEERRERPRPASPAASTATATATATAASTATTVAAPAVRYAAHVAGIPNRMPPRPAPLPAVAEAPVAPARGAQGEEWSPVPVPTPTYLSAPVAPRRRVDLTRPGAYSDELAQAEREVGIVDEGPQLDEILDRRRAVNDW